MVIEFARTVAGLAGASSSEFDPDTEFPVIATMAEQVDFLDHQQMGGTMRLGLYQAALEPGSLVEELYDAPTVGERHRHRYEVNNHYREQIADAGMVFSGVSPDRSLVEFVELPRDVHPFYVGTQAHPELRSRPNRAHPLFRGLVAAALEHEQASRLFEVPEPGEHAIAQTDDGATDDSAIVEPASV
jgi:CTP synthase